MHTDQHDLLAGLHVEDTGVPIYVQLRDQLLAALGAGRIAPGGRMPTMRQVAVALRVDLNTVRHAYDQLERRGAVVLVRGRGSFVAGVAPAPSAVSSSGPALDAAANRALLNFTAAGLDPAAVAQRILALAEGGSMSQESSS